MAQQQASDWGKQWGQVVAKAWADAAFKQRLLADPHAVLKEHGLEVPRGLQVKVVENTDSVRHLILPTKPSSDELSEEALGVVAGGYKWEFCDVVPDPNEHK
jgi:Nitrile hydratase, alpha chain